MEFTISTESRIQEPPKKLGEYRYRLNKMRRALVRDAINAVVDRADQRVRALAVVPEPEEYTGAKVDLPDFHALKEDVAERHNQSDTGLRFEMWPESHLERLLAMRPDLIDEFGLR